MHSARRLCRGLLRAAGCPELIERAKGPNTLQSGGVSISRPKGWRRERERPHFDFRSRRELLNLARLDDRIAGGRSHSVVIQGIRRIALLRASRLARCAAVSRARARCRIHPTAAGGLFGCG